MVVDRVRKKVKGWKEKALSKAGKEVLIKAVVQAIPNYIMGCYKMPEGVCQEIESIVAKFWWGNKDEERKIHWMRWEKISKTKNSGGLGFRGFSEFNMSLLGKHFWRLMTEKGSLFERVFKSRYYPNCSIVESKIGFNPSYAWRSIYSYKELVQSGTRWCIGNGEQVIDRKDNWIPTVAGFKVLGQLRNAEPNALVSFFIDKELGQWKSDLVNNSFEAVDAQHILGIPLSRRNIEDKQVWHYEKCGDYSVKYAHHVCCRDKLARVHGPSYCSNQKLWKKLWNAPIHPRIKYFLWRLAKNILPTKTNLRRKGIALDETCSLCQNGAESVTHLFSQCDYTRRMFFASVTGSHVRENVDLTVWLSDLLSNNNVFFVQVSCYLLHQVWKARNLKLYQQKSCDPIRMAMDAVVEFNEHNHPGLKVKTCVANESTTVTNCEFHTVKVDAGTGENDVITFGCVVCDINNNPMVSTCRREDFRASPKLAKCLALRWSIEIAASLQIRKVIFQSDAKAIVDCVNAIAKDVSVDVVAADCRVLLNSFTSSCIMFIPRKLNSTAHALAQLAKSVGSRTWLGPCPLVEATPNVTLPSV